MRTHTVMNRFFVCLVGMLLVVMPATPAFADEILPTLEVGDGIAEVNPPTIAEFEHYGPQTPHTSREAISQASTHIATPEQARRAEEATTYASVNLGPQALGTDPAMSASLAQNGDSLAEGLVVALGGVAIVAFSLLLYHFRKE